MQPTPAAPQQQPPYPPGQPTAPASTGYPAPQAPKKRSRWPIILVAFGVLGLLCCGGIAIVAAMGGNDNNVDSPSAGGIGGDAAKTKATLGMAVRDGKFEFVVTDAKCGLAKVGTSPVGKQAQGQFCLVTIKVKSIGKEAQTFSDSSQKAYGSTGAEYSTDTGAGLYANQDADVFLNEINPGNEITGVLVFDIPKDAKLVRLELHDSPFSGGVDVTIG